MSIKTSIVFLGIYAILRLFVRGFTQPHGQYIEFLDVGQGDAIFISTVNGKHILIDAGPDYSIDYYLSEKFYLKPCVLDLVIVTHKHLDHYGGLERIFKRCHIGSVIHSFKINDVVSADLDNASEQQNLFRGDVFEIDQISFCVLWPPNDSDFISHTNNINNTSIVFLIDYGAFEALFTGDAEVDVWRKLVVPSSCKVDGKLDVLKVAHHGSINGLYRPLLSSLKPITSIISVGSDNKYGHPSPKVIDFLNNIGSKVFRTDLVGNIVINF